LILEVTRALILSLGLHSNRANILRTSKLSIYSTHIFPTCLTWQ